MRYFIHAVFLLVFSVVQPTWLGYIEVFGVKPNLFLIYTIILSCNCQKKEGAIVGFFFGLLLDLFIGKAIGLNAVLMMILSFAVTDFCDKYIRHSTLITTIVIVFISVICYEFIYYVIAFLGDLKMGAAMLRVVIPESLYCALFAIPMYFVMPKKENLEQL